MNRNGLVFMKVCRKLNGYMECFLVSQKRFVIYAIYKWHPSADTKQFADVVASFVDREIIHR